jgi:hypothetical protein
MTFLTWPLSSYSRSNLSRNVLVVVAIDDIITMGNRPNARPKGFRTHSLSTSVVEKAETRSYWHLMSLKAIFVLTVVSSFRVLNKTIGGNWIEKQRQLRSKNSFCCVSCAALDKLYHCSISISTYIHLGAYFIQQRPWYDVDRSVSLPWLKDWADYVGRNESRQRATMKVESTVRITASCPVTDPESPQALYQDGTF